MHNHTEPRYPHECIIYPNYWITTSGPSAGMIVLSVNQAVVGCVPCDGSAYPILKYPDLFGVIGHKMRPPMLKENVKRWFSTKVIEKRNPLFEPGYFCVPKLHIGG